MRAFNWMFCVLVLACTLVACDESEETDNPPAKDEESIGMEVEQDTDEVVYEMTYRDQRTNHDVEVLVTESWVYGERTAHWQTWVQTGILGGARLTTDYKVGPEKDLKLMGAYNGQPLFVAGNNNEETYLYLGAEQVGPKIQ